MPYTHLNISAGKELKFQYKTPLGKDLVAICFYTVDGGFNFTINDKVFESIKNDLILINCINSSYTHEFILSNNTLEITNIIVSIIFRE